MKTSDELTIGDIYSRKQLRATFGINDATINTGIFQPVGHDSIWLFVTEKKTADRTQYDDLLNGDLLDWDSQSSGRKDHLIIEHHQRNLELLLFYREKKNQYRGYGFRYEGPFDYLSHAGSNPAHFKLARAGSILETRRTQLDDAHSGWLQRERRTATLIRSCYTYLLKTRRAGAQEIEALCKLTWITKGPDYWRTTKLPALKTIYRLDNDVATLQQVVTALPHDSELADATLHVLAETGIVNFYNAFRGAVGHWVAEHEAIIASLLTRAFGLASDDHGRELAATISSLPPVPRPDGGGAMDAAKVLTPVVACLDPRGRFPIMNGRPAVQQLLGQLGAARADLPEQHDRLVPLIGRLGLGISDAFELDVWADQGLPRNLNPSRAPTKPLSAATVDGRDLPLKDEADVDGVRATGSVKIRRLHNRITNALKTLCEGAGLEVQEGIVGNALFDALVIDYDGTRDLLIEAKSSTDRGVIRLAVGQLLDYRRNVPRPAATDLAVLLPMRPDDAMAEFLSSLGIKLVWIEFDLNQLVGDWELGPDTPTA